MSKVVRIANGQGFWGDSIDAPVRLVEAGGIDYLTLDYLAEVTLSIMQKQRRKDPQLGYATDFVDLMKRVLPQLKAKGIRVVANAGGVNPEACRAAVLEVAQEAGRHGPEDRHGHRRRRAGAAAGVPGEGPEAGQHGHGRRPLRRAAGDPQRQCLPADPGHGGGPGYRRRHRADGPLHGSRPHPGAPHPRVQVGRGRLEPPRRGHRRRPHPGVRRAKHRRQLHPLVGSARAVERGLSHRGSARRTAPSSSPSTRAPAAWSPWTP